MTRAEAKRQNKKLLKGWWRRFKSDPSMRRKMRRDSSGKNNPSKKPESRAAISKGQVKAWKDKGIRARRSKAMKAAWKRDYTWRAAIQKDPKMRAKISKAMKGRDPIGRPRGPRTVWYVGKCGRVAMRSKSEVRYAKMLDKAGVKWLYEYCTFVVGNKTWTPDFYLPFQKKFVEIKGWLLDWVKRKISSVRRHYASTVFEIVDSERLVWSP